MIKLNFRDTYDIADSCYTPPKYLAEFDVPQKDGTTVRMFVKLAPHTDPFLMDVYNLCLGPLQEDGEIDDNIRLKHVNVAKVLSTAVLVAYNFMVAHPRFSIGIDGSDDLRANLYHSMFVHNKNSMSSFFICSGVDWYVKLLRNKKDVERDENGYAVFRPDPESFDYERERKNLYGYYLLSLKYKLSLENKILHHGRENSTEIRSNT